MTLPFLLKPPEGLTCEPRWSGEAFVFGNQSTPILMYSENFDGWSDDLTALHEEVVGDSHPIDVASRKDALAQVSRFIPSAEAVIMEVGCSSGYLLRDLVNAFPEAVLVGVDVVKEPLYRLARSLPGIPLIGFDLLQCPLPDQSVDVLIMLNVLEHINDDVKALQKAFKLLKPGGTLIIEVPAGPRLYDSYDAELRHFRRYSASELKRKLNESEFTVLRQSHLGFVLYPMFVAAKLLNKCMPFTRKTKIVRDQATITSGSLFLKLAMNFETNYLGNFRLPFGIRLLAVARRPE
jgi:SAM-dependent methyltransferase